MIFYLTRSKIIFQSTHPSWGATPDADVGLIRQHISIHAPIVGCDYQAQATGFKPEIFQSTHPSWGATNIRKNTNVSVFLFQSTHPSWGATPVFCLKSVLIVNFNPRTHRGVRHVLSSLGMLLVLISIHAPIVGCDIYAEWSWLDCIISIHAPIVGCDGDAHEDAGYLYISIHAPIVGCDFMSYNAFFIVFYFNPRTHRGVRLLLTLHYLMQY